MTDILDDLAAFLMHRTTEIALSDADRLRIFALVGAYQEGDEPAQIESTMRAMALKFANHVDYQPAWRRAASETAALDECRTGSASDGSTAGQGDR
jgi:hypothetical protein